MFLGRLVSFLVFLLMLLSNEQIHSVFTVKICCTALVRANISALLFSSLFSSPKETKMWLQLLYTSITFSSRLSNSKCCFFSYAYPFFGKALIFHWFEKPAQFSLFTLNSATTAFKSQGCH